MALYNVMLLGELLFSLWSSRTLFKLLTAVNLYCIAYDAYVAFYTVGIFAYSLVILLNLPYLMGLLALLLNPHSVFRRRALFTIAKLVYAFKFVSDLWTALSIGPDVEALCEAVVTQEPSVA